MSYKIVFTSSAESTYESIKLQLIKRWGYHILSDFEKRLDKHFSLRSLNPLIYPIINDKLEIRRCIIHSNCSLLFTIKNDDLVILAFWDNRQEPLY